MAGAGFVDTTRARKNTRRGVRQALKRSRPLCARSEVTYYSVVAQRYLLTFRNLDNYDAGAMARHPSVLPLSKAHQNMGIRCGYDCDQGQRRPGGACLSPM